MEPHVSLSGVEALLIHSFVSKDRPVSSQVSRLTPAWLIRSNFRFLSQGALMRGMLQLKHLSWWSLHRDQKKKKPVKEQRLAYTHLKTPGNRSRSVERFRKRRLWSSEESWDSQVSMWRLKEDEVKQKTMDKSSTSPLGHFRDFLECVRVSLSGLADVY